MSTKRKAVMVKEMIALGALTAGMAYAAAGFAQTEAPEASAEQQDLGAQLEAARERLEAAARDVARLSAELAGPVVEEVTRPFRGTRRAMLGITIDDAEGGAAVAAVTPGGPADEAGVRTGDVIVAVDGEALASGQRSPSRALIGRMRNIEPGERVTLKVRRGGGEHDVVVEAQPLPRGPWVAAREAPGWREGRRLFDGPWMLMHPFGRWRGMELVELTPELGAYFGTEQGILVVRAPNDESLGLRDGDVILEIAGRRPNSPQHAMRILGGYEPGETLSLTIMRDHRRETLDVTIPEADTASTEDAA